MYVTKLTVYFSIIMRGSMTLWGQRATLSFLQKKVKYIFLNSVICSYECLRYTKLQSRNKMWGQRQASEIL